ncbi:response regulator transcription factor [Cohnella cellulosilytica]|uniref:Response regulator n=1 Tax=Cohnella cellulosilytica TaxID=986710 RepID=A0ABW2FEZ7_9BACL
MYHVLIAEDEQWIRQSVAEMINRMGDDFVLAGEARNGQEAWTLIEELWPAILVTDVMMPQMDGLALIERVVEQQIPMTFVILSGYDNFEYARRAIRYGVTEYLLKPVQMEQLHEALKRSAAQLGSNGELNRLLVGFRNLLDRFDPADSGLFYRKALQLIDQVLAMPRLDGPAKLNLLRLFEHRLLSLLRDLQAPASALDIGRSTDDPTIRRHLQTLLETWVLHKSESAALDNHRTAMRKACEYIGQHYKKDISLTQMAAATHMSVSHFSLRFKEYTGKTLVQYIQETRIHKAKELLRDTSLKAYEIAEETGFSTHSYFVRVFKNTTGLSPGEYKKRINP